MGTQCVNQPTLCVCCSGTEVQNWLIILKKIENYHVLLWMLWAGLSLVHCKINLSQTKVGLQFSISGWDVHVGLPGSPPCLTQPSLLPISYTRSLYSDNHFILDLHYCKVGLFMNNMFFSLTVNVHMPKDRVTQSHQGYGFVEFMGEEDADYAIKIMNMIKLYGKPIRVNKVKSVPFSQFNICYF